MSFTELRSRAKVDPEWQKCRQAILNGAESYLRLHWGKGRGFFSALLTGKQGHQRALQLKQFVSGLDLSTEKGQRDLMASVSAIRLSSSTFLTNEMDTQLKRLNSKDATFSVNKFNAEKLGQREQELRRQFDGEKTGSTFTMRLKFGASRA